MTCERYIFKELGMAPRTTKQFEEIRESRRQQIMNVALELFADKGFASTSISSIATKASISKGLMYNYFSSKKQLLDAIFSQGIDDLMKIFDPNKDGVLTKNEYIFFISESFEMINRERKFWKLYYALLMQPSVWTLVENRFNAFISSFLKIMTDYYRQKGVKNPESEAILVGALMDGISFNYVLNPEIYPLDELKKLVIERFI